MPKPIEDLTAILQAGGGFEISALDYDPTVLAGVIGQMNQSSVLRVRDAAHWTQDQLISVAQNAPPGVAEFVF
ncbi:hypothetical protein [Caulobacter segnis]|uniref:hypothetical protein n=1 Tax=Caulobacter segnis TaxID=88688 RepID=UPI00285C88DD|nr:hypothetical protein [Caulobacter segnis]MDR6624229.1 hypothetical protein [Caulobacter segnis]